MSDDEEETYDHKVLNESQQCHIKRYAKLSREVRDILYEEKLIDELRSLYTYTSLQKSHHVKDLIRAGCFSDDEMATWKTSSEFLHVPLTNKSPDQIVLIENYKAQRAKLNRIVRNIVAKLLKEVFYDEAEILEKEAAKRRSLEAKKRRSSSEQQDLKSSAQPATSAPTGTTAPPAGTTAPPPATAASPATAAPPPNKVVISKKRVVEVHYNIKEQFLVPININLEDKTQVKNWEVTWNTLKVYLVNGKMIEIDNRGLVESFFEQPNPNPNKEYRIKNYNDCNVDENDEGFNAIDINKTIADDDDGINEISEAFTKFGLNK
jgi:hypothetical protein